MSNNTVVESTWLVDLKKRVQKEEECQSRMSHIRSSSADNENSMRNLDSALKKTTAFMKKLKALNAAAVGGLIEDLSKLNLSKFVEEMATGVAETRLKLSDVTPVVELCVAISSKYTAFNELLLGELKKGLPMKKTDKVTNPAKLRIDIVFLAELVLSGVFLSKEGLHALGTVLSFLVQTDKIEHNNVGLLSTVFRQVGWQIAGIVPSPSSSEAATTTIVIDELPTPSALTSDHRKTIRDLLLNYLDSLAKRTEKLCAARNAALKKVKRQERTRGDAGEEEKTSLKMCQDDLDRVRGLYLDMNSALGQKAREFGEEQSDDEEDEAAAQEIERALADGELTLWPDDESKAFYENLVDIRGMVPKALYKESENQTIEMSPMQKCFDDIDVDNIDGGEIDEESRSAVSSDQPRAPSPIANTLTISTAEAGSEDNKQRWQKLLLDLDHLVSKDLTDDAALYFVSNLNTKSNRKRLVKLLSSPASSRLDLLPFYARLVAVLESVMPDLTSEIVNLLIAQFKEILKGNSDRLDAKLSCVLLISELTKFGVIPRAECLSCLRQLVYDLRGHAVDMCSAMLESAGIYLYRNRDSHPKMKRLLEVIKAKRDRMKDNRQIMLIDNAYFACLPPEERQVQRATELPMKRFIRHIIVDITEDTIDNHLRCLRRIDWSDPDISDYAIQYLSSPWLLPLSNLPHLASVISGLACLSHYEWVGVAVVDNVIETIRLSLEIPGAFNQFAQAAVVYFGELYVYKLCDHALVLDVLYLLLSYPETDPLAWQDLHRVRMICAILSISAEYFQKGSLLRRIRCFLLYFYRYYYTKYDNWTKEMRKLINDGDDVKDDDSVGTKFPYEVETAFSEIARLYRHSRGVVFEFPKDLNEANEAVAKMEKEIREKMDIALDGASDDEKVGPAGRSGLFAIAEEEDDEEEHRLSDEVEDTMVDDDEDEDAKVCVHMEQQKQASAEEDEEFQRELDRMLADGLRNTTSTTSSSANFDLTVPSAARNRLERTCKFVDEKGAKISLSHEKEPKVQKTPKVTLMARGKGNKPQLKTVTIDDVSLHDSWKKEKERVEREREDNKRVTLEHTRRIQHEEEQQMLASFHNQKFAGRRK